MDTIDVAVVYVDGPAAFFLLPPWRERGLGGRGGGAGGSTHPESVVDKVSV